jgi:site-specific DNA-methyltransferase (adenine-specific)
MEYKLFLGDCLEELKKLEDNSIDSIVTDPPYGISFMASKWDYDVPKVDIWKECLRVLKPGGHLLSFSSARTYHRMVVNVEDAGFEIRDQIMWVYGSGFPKSHNIGKAIDKKLGNDREIVGKNPNHRDSDALYELGFQGGKSDGVITKGTSEWEGWGTALKPAHEPIVMARKPFKGNVANNVIKHGTGAINIDGCRVETTDTYSYPNGPQGNSFSVNEEPDNKRNKAVKSNPLGRWPANFIHDGSDEVVDLFPEYKSVPGGFGGGHQNSYVGGKCEKPVNEKTVYTDDGSAARFFYCPKANKKDREENNSHPTVKPTDLMRYLCRLITPKNGTVLDPFCGSGSTGKAAMLEGFNFVGIELSEEYLEIAEKRIKNASDR